MIYLCLGILFHIFSGQTIPLNIELRPDMLPVESISPSMPLSWTSDKEECSMQYGLNLTSGCKYQWITEPDSGIDILVDCQVLQNPYSVRMLVWDYQGKVIHIEEIGNAPCRIPLHVKIHGYGVYLITLDAIDKNGVWQSRLIRSVAALPDNSDLIDVWRSENDYVVGSSFFPHRYGFWTGYKYSDMSADEAVNAIALLAQRIGFQALRVDYKQANPFETERMDTIVSILTNCNLKINFKLAAYTAANTEEPALSVWNGNIVAFVERYHNVAWLFEIGNEPAHTEFFDGDWDRYLILLTNAYLKIKEAVPSAVVVHGGLCPWDTAPTSRGYGWYTNFIKNAALYNDSIAYHFHGTLADAENSGWITDYKTLYQTAGGGNIPWVQTEGGVSLWRVYEDVHRTPLLLQKIFWSWASGDTGWIQFALFQDISSSWANSDTKNWAIFNEATFCPKFPAGQLSALINRFAGYTSGGILYENDVLLLLKFNSSDERTSVVGFTKDGSVVNVNFILDDCAVTRSFDPQGNCLSTTTDNVIIRDFSVYPCWIETAGNILSLQINGIDIYL